MSPCLCLHTSLLTTHILAWGLILSAPHKRTSSMLNPWSCGSAHGRPVPEVRQVKLVGELYNYRLVDSVLVFDSLYQHLGDSGSQRLWAMLSNMGKQVTNQVLL